ncbi:hypothetical protein [Carnobacterium sp.]|uniref:hypothetical protein n=1 Tax=Carnobacterium sp. TaxID=48221 RepID=UPI00388F025D
MNILNEKSLTAEEKAVVEAMRLGAKVDVTFHQLKGIEEVDERMNLFSEFEVDKIS